MDLEKNVGQYLRCEDCGIIDLRICKKHYEEIREYIGKKEEKKNEKGYINQSETERC